MRNLRAALAALGFDLASMSDSEISALAVGLVAIRLLACPECHRALGHKMDCNTGAVLYLGGNPDLQRVRCGVLVWRTDLIGSLAGMVVLNEGGGVLYVG